MAIGTSLFELFKSGAVLVVEDDVRVAEATALVCGADSENLAAEMAALELAVCWSENIRYGADAE